MPTAASSRSCASSAHRRASARTDRDSPSSSRSTSASPCRCSPSPRGCSCATRSGVDPAVASRVMTESPIGSPMLKARAPLVLDLPEEAWFDVSLMHKDIRLGAGGGERTRPFAPVGQRSRRRALASRAARLSPARYRSALQGARKRSGPMSEPVGAPLKRRGRPRSEKACTAILEAATELLLEQGLETVSMDEVAERAGVSKATIYRWWPSKQTLALDALYHEWDTARAEPPDTGSLRADLLALLRPWIRRIRARPYGRVVAELVAEAQTDPEFAVDLPSAVRRAAPRTGARARATRDRSRRAPPRYRRRACARPRLRPALPPTPARPRPPQRPLRPTRGRRCASRSRRRLETMSKLGGAHDFRGSRAGENAETSRCD